MHFFGICNFFFIFIALNGGRILHIPLNFNQQMLHWHQDFGKNFAFKMYVYIFFNYFQIHLFLNHGVNQLLQNFSNKSTFSLKRLTADSRTIV